MFDDRPQPHNLEVERAILASAIKFKEVSRINDNRVDVETFYSHIHREVFKAAIEVKKSGLEVDLLTVAHQLSKNGMLEDIGGEVFLAELSQEIATDVNLDNWIKIHLEYYAKRLMINHCSETLLKCYSDDSGALELFNNHRSGLSDVELYSCGMMQKPTSEKLIGFVNYLDDLQTGKGGHVIPFGIPGIDDFIQLQLKQMLVLGGLSNTGKTRFVLCDAIGKARKNVASAIFSFENPANIIISGMVSIISGIPMFAMTRKEGLNQLQMQSIHEALEFMKEHEHLIYIFGKGEYEHSVSGMSAEIRRIQDNTSGRLKAVYVDYLQNMKADKKLGRVEQIESCVAGLSEITAEYNIAGMVLSQLNRDKDRDKSRRRPILADMKGSGEIENAADYVVFLHKANKGDQGDIELDFYSEKVRGTNSFDEKMMFDTRTGTMSGIAPKPSRYSSEDQPQQYHNKGAQSE